MRSLIDSALPQHHLQLALELVGGIGLCYFGRSVLSSVGSLFNFSIAQRCVRDLRIALLDQMNRLSADYHEQTPTGEKLTRIEYDVDEIANLGADTHSLYFLISSGGVKGGVPFKVYGVPKESTQWSFLHTDKNRFEMSSPLLRFPRPPKGALQGRLDVLPLAL